MQSDPTTEHGESLVDVLFGAVTERRHLSYDERLELKRRVSDRVRELVPYVKDRDGHLDAHIDRIAAKVTEAPPVVNPRTYAIHDLSPFECDVLALMLQGQTDKDAAETLGVAPATVSKGALNVVHKLGAKNRVHAVARLFAAVVEGVGKSNVEKSPDEAVEHARPCNLAGRQAQEARLSEALELPSRPQADSRASA